MHNMAEAQSPPIMLEEAALSISELSTNHPEDALLNAVEELTPDVSEEESLCPLEKAPLELLQKIFADLSSLSA